MGYKVWDAFTLERADVRLAKSGGAWMASSDVATSHSLDVRLRRAQAREGFALGLLGGNGSLGLLHRLGRPLLRNLEQGKPWTAGQKCEA